MSNSTSAQGGAVEPMAHRKWWPLNFMDEDMPAGGDTPDAFLSRLDDGGHAYRAPDDPDSAEYSLSEGEIVEFVCRDTLGTARLVFEDGEPCWTPLVPTACNHLWDGDEIIADSPQEFEDQIRESIALGWSDSDALVRLSRWSVAQLRFRFTAEEGPPRFVPLDPIPGPPGVFVEAPADTQTDLFRPTPES